MTHTAKLTAAAALAAEVHHGQCRDEGTPYIEHPLRVAHIAATEAGLSDPDLIAAAYLHDTIEDAQDPDAIRARIRESFGQRVLDAVEILTKSPDQSISKEQRDTTYHQGLREAPHEVRVLKICDRVDNTRFLIKCPDSKKRASYLKETEEKYLPLAAETGVLYEELKRATEKVRELYGPPE
jgi:(p)ppGpp synthase/HD superfamily hydrolase